MLQKNNIMKENQRVKVMETEGTIAYIGDTEFGRGEWIGVVLDRERGNTNGTIRGISYFHCPENYGIFVKEHIVFPLPQEYANDTTEDSENMKNPEEEKFVEDNSTWAEDFPIVQPPEEFADDPTESIASPKFCFCCSIPDDSSIEHTSLINSVPIQTESKISETNDQSDIGKYDKNEYDKNEYTLHASVTWQG